ncbi:sn-glycerol-3-phosphate ABC transporter ATP-binding protein UgpC [Pseudanabaena sp. FACHB-2040]|uniref:sn-glycerol-3-phosphate ABC transporter ATP-binding protein UgpC n=1 Tax=Pseudanabaena sp. FACHB-2040 TaxID=2692859 RepID=UPI001686E80B|nr:sn-glycerol-3-phosphate ABC transporter ATP-binding protein UgpC [Pseudanabaena sp. FACHB-2040]
MARVKLDNITRRFGGSTAIHNITFEVPDGAFWVLVGPSGCGKSTILRTIAGLEPVTEGNLYIGDALVNQVAARDRDVAMVFQNYALYPHMSVAQNLAFGLRMRQSPVAERQARIEAVARSLDIAHLLDRKPRQLSGGQQQRVALGRAIARQPRVFLLDEPLSNLDAQLRDDTRAELKQLHQQFGITTLYVTHDQVEAMTLADKIVVLHQGQIQQIGTPQEVYAQPANRMVATFIGNPPMNILEATWNDGIFRVDTQKFACPGELVDALPATKGQLVNLGIRPEHIHITSPEAAHLHIRVAVVEPLGRETLVRGILPDSARTIPQVLHLQTAPDVVLQPGDTLPIRLDLERLFLFEATTGQRH